MIDQNNPRKEKAIVDNLTSEKPDERSGAKDDLKDSARDEERLKPETVILDLPDVEDIPGQEHVKAPPLGMLADTTISSDDEEGIGLLDDEKEEEI